MRITMTRKSLLTALLVLAMATAIGYQALGAALLAGQPTVVVTVNLGKVMEKLDQWNASVARVKKLTDDLKLEQSKRTGELDAMKKDAETIQAEYDKTTDPKQRTALEARMQGLQEDAAMKTLDYQAWVSFSAEKADIESAIATQDAYRSIKAAAAQMASANHYDIVMVDDSQGEIVTNADSRTPRVQQAQQQMATRRLLYVNPVIDITDDLIQRMNNAYKAAGPGKAP